MTGTFTKEAVRRKLLRYIKNGYLLTTGMSSRFSAQITACLLLSQIDSGIIGNLAEIGVYMGRFYIVLALSAVDGEVAIAIDRFDWPDSGLLDRFLQNTKLHGVPSEVVLAIKADTQNINTQTLRSNLNNNPVRFFHIDGDHRTLSLLHDLKIAARVLHEEGIICVDDMMHPCYPLLGEAVSKFLSENPEFVVFCVIDRNNIIEAGKFLICKKAYSKRYADLLAKTFSKNIFALAADFESYNAMVLAPRSKFQTPKMLLKLSRFVRRHLIRLY